MQPHNSLSSHPLKLLLPFLLLFTLFFAAVNPAQAHEESLASTNITFENKRMLVTLLIDQRSVLELQGVDITKVTTLSEAELTEAVQQKTFDYIRQGFHATNNGAAMELELEGMSVPDLSNVQVDLVFASDELIDTISIDYNLWFETSNGKHKNVAVIESNGGETVSEFIFTDSNRELALDAGLEVPFWTAVGQFFILGVEHIWFGYDHVLFVVALILLGGKFWNIVKIITSFTVAHSVTLILASLEIVSLPGALVESIIALSILYIALENQFVKHIKYRWIITFAFGLIHGFGFAGALSEIQIPKNHFISSLLTFNLGVEIGQIVIVAVLLPIIWFLQRFEWNRWVVRTVSLGIAVFGLNWFIDRAFGYTMIPFLNI